MGIVENSLSSKIGSVKQHTEKIQMSESQEKAEPIGVLNDFTLSVLSTEELCKAATIVSSYLTATGVRETEPKWRGKEYS